MRTQRGLSLVELMVSITIGLFILAGLTTLFVNSSRSQAETFKASQQIENGRYAIDLLTQDLHHAGYYGEFSYLPPLPGAPMPYPAAALDPCDLDPGDMLAALPLPIQGFNNPGGAPLNCLADADHVDGTDIVVVRRADTQILLETGGAHGIPAAPAATATPVLNEVYLQTDANNVEVQLGSGAAINKTMKANGSAATIIRKDYSTTPTSFAAAYLRKFRTHIYFIAPCSVPADGDTTCTGAADDNGRPIPTLKRLELSSDGAALDFRIVPLVEGVENLQLEYGRDTVYLPNPLDPTALPPSGLPGDGSPDGAYLTAPALADWKDIVAAKVFLLARNTEPSTGYADAKTYQVGTAATSTPGGNFKRHLYAAEVRLVNPSGRREIPR